MKSFFYSYSKHSKRVITLCQKEKTAAGKEIKFTQDLPVMHYSINDGEITIKTCIKMSQRVLSKFRALSKGVKIYLVTMFRHFFSHLDGLIKMKRINCTNTKLAFLIYHSAFWNPINARSSITSSFLIKDYNPIDQVFEGSSYFVFSSATYPLLGLISQKCRVPHQESLKCYLTLEK